MTDRKLSRRAYLQGAGKIAIALPVADFCMRDGRIYAAEGDAPIMRLLTYSFPNGMDAAQWTYSAACSPLQGLQGKIALIRNVANPASAPGDHHEQGAGTMFVGRKMPPQEGQKAQNSGGLSLDQYAAATLAPGTPIRSLVAGIWRAQGEFLYPKAWYRRSWDANGNALEPIVNPKDIFKEIFGAALGTDQAERTLRASVLDAVLELYKHTVSDRSALGKDAKQRLTQHLDIVRDVEKKVSQQQEQFAAACQIPDANGILGTASAGDVIPYEQWYDVFRAQWQLFVLGMKCDAFRFGSLMFGSAAQKYLIASVNPADEHACAHAPDGGASVLAYRIHHMQQLAAFLAALDAVQEGDGRTLLDNTVVVAASEHETTGGGHGASPMPHLVAGGTGRIARLGQVVDASGRGIVDLYRDCLRAIGADPAGFGDGALASGSIIMEPA